MMMTGAPIRAVKYLRQSQALGDDELAVLRQDGIAENLAVQHGLTVVGKYVDNDKSATSGKVRPAYQQMLADWAAGGFDAIIAYDLDRLYRLPRELEDLIDLAEKRGLLLYTASGEADLQTDGGRLFARIKAAVAKAEIERKSARHREANNQSAKKGEPYWRLRPFGYTKDKQLCVPEANAIRDGYIAYLAGESLSAIARSWNEAGLLSPKEEGWKRGGREWQAATVLTLLKSHRPAGIRLYRERVGKTPSGEPIFIEHEIPGTWPAIVDEVTWRTARRLMAQNAARRPKGGRRGIAENLLSGIATCGNEGCEGRIVAARSSSKTRIYKCDARSHLGRSAAPIEAAVRRYIINVLSSPDAERLLVDEHVPDFAALEAARIEMRGRLEELSTDYYVRRSLSRAQFDAANEALTAELRGLDLKMERPGRTALLGALIGRDDIEEVWDGLPLERQRAIAQALLRVVILPRTDPRAAATGTSFELVPLERG